MELVFASANANKVAEIQAIVPPSVKVLGLADIGCSEELPETSPTIAGNASQKAFYVYNKYHRNCFADDTGLEVDALDGRPGVLSARYAGPAKDPVANIEKVLSELRNNNNRKARFVTVLSLVIDGKEVLFEGTVTGHIAMEMHGSKGFGYDPVFIPDGEDRSFAEMSVEEKNLISHRGRAVRKLVQFLRSMNS